jgi:hypothetical protein
MIGGVLKEDRSLRSLSKPVESTRRLKDATQNQTRIENVSMRCRPSDAIVIVKAPRCVWAMARPGVKNNIGRVIMAANAGTKNVLEMRYRSGILEAIAKMRGTVHISAIYGREEMKSEATIMKAIATSLARGFIA